jgi:hypothetical protein
MRAGLAMTLRLSSFGAIADGKFDNVDRMNYAFDVARHEMQELVVPAGQWAYGHVLSMTDIVLRAEPGAVLHALDPLQSVLFVFMGADHGAANDNRIETCAGAGIRSDHSSFIEIARNVIIGTLADSIHMTDRSTDLTVIGNLIDSSGDDGIAVVSYRDDGGMVQRVKAIGNRVTNNLGGRGMSIVGGADVTYADNFVKCKTAAGIIVAQENSYRTFGVHKALISRCTLVDCGKVEKDHPALLIMSEGGDSNSDITVARCHIRSDVPNKGGVRVFGSITNALIDSNEIRATPELRLDTPGVVVKPFTDGPVGISA